MGVLRGKVNPARFDPENKVYYQSAYYGSRVDYDKPSLEAIGSGEGAQAHGYGLYYALIKDVAERYRETFVSADRSKGQVFEVDIPENPYLSDEMRSLEKG